MPEDWHPAVPSPHQTKQSQIPKHTQTHWITDPRHHVPRIQSKSQGYISSPVSMRFPQFNLLSCLQRWGRSYLIHLQKSIVKGHVGNAV